MRASAGRLIEAENAPEFISRARADRKLLARDTSVKVDVKSKGGSSGNFTSDFVGRAPSETESREGLGETRSNGRNFCTVQFANGIPKAEAPPAQNSRWRIYVRA